MKLFHSPPAKANKVTPNCCSPHDMWDMSRLAQEARAQPSRGIHVLGRPKPLPVPQFSSTLEPQDVFLPSRSAPTGT